MDFLELCLLIQLLKLSYTVIIRIHMEYCSLLFMSAAKTHLKKLDTIQSIAARIIYEVPRDTHAEPLLILPQLDPLGDRRKQHMVKLVKSSVSGSSHPAMTLLFHQLPHGAVSVPHSRTALGKRRPSGRSHYMVCFRFRLRGILIPIRPRYKELKMDWS